MALTFAVHVALVMFIWIVYATDSDLGSPKAVWKALKDVAGKDRDCSIIPAGQSCGPVKGNYKGTYLTMLSNGGLVSRSSITSRMQIMKCRTEALRKC
jgi:hypothetical protein